MSKLPCGCEPGFFLCVKAVNLWTRVRILSPITTEENNREYKKALYAYDLHVSGLDSTKVRP